jgi:hypothetical protein
MRSASSSDFSPRGELLPFRMSKIAGDTPRREYQVIVRQFTAAVPHALVRQIDLLHFSHHDGKVWAVGENCAHRLRNVDRRESRGGYLIQQRLEKMMILPVDHRNPREILREVAHKSQACESSPDDDDMRQRRIRRRFH